MTFVTYGGNLLSHTFRRHTDWLHYASTLLQVHFNAVQTWVKVRQKCLTFKGAFFRLPLRRDLTWPWNANFFGSSQGLGLSHHVINLAPTVTLFSRKIAKLSQNWHFWSIFAKKRLLLKHPVPTGKNHTDKIHPVACLLNISLYTQWCEIIFWCHQDFLRIFVYQHVFLP